MIKKICVGLIIGLVAVDLLCFGRVFLNIKNKKVANTNETIQNTELNENLIKNEIIAEENNTEDIQNTVTEQVVEIPTITETTVKEQQEIKQQPIPETKTTSTTKKQTNNTTQNKQVNTKTTTKPQVQENKPTTTQTQAKIEKKEQKNEEKNQETKSAQISKEPAEKFIKNDTLINKLKQTIENNPSDFMKQYGYQIVVDSSIKSQTNPFTFYESRVTPNLKYKFGTIRIYAEDIYQNGQFIMSVCYMI